MKDKIIELFDTKKEKYTRADRKLFEDFKKALNKGEIRSAELVGDEWKVNTWVKKGILLGFRMGKIVDMSSNPDINYTDKDTYPVRIIDSRMQVRLVPGGSAIRDGVYVAKGVTIMPPAYVNVGAYIDEGTLVDSHALVGSCAQIGKNVHLSAGAMIGGVIEPVGANPVIVEDNAFIGGNTGVYEGVIIKKRAVLTPGVTLTASTNVFDAVNNCFLDKTNGLAIPENAIVVQGSKQLKANPEFSVYCPIIVKYRDEKTDLALILEDALR